MLDQRLSNFIDENIIPDNGIYSSRPWYISIQSYISTILKYNHGNRYILEHFENKPNAVSYLREMINALFIMNNDKYQKIFEALTAEFNPLWNVDGIETLTYVKDNTGTQRNDNISTNVTNINGTNTGTQQTRGTNTGSQSTSGSNTGNQTINGSNTGNTETFDTTGNISTASATTFDANNELETNATNSANSGSVKRVDNLADSTQRIDNLNHSETRTDNLSHSDTRTDNLAHTEKSTSSGSDDNLRTDNLKEEYTEVKERHGNIGVTKSTELIEDAVLLRLKYNFSEIVANDIVSFITYS